MEAFAGGCGGPAEEYEDLVQVGSTALLGAIDRCDPKRGDEFLAFAVPAIADDIRRHLRDATQAIPPPDDSAEHGGTTPPDVPGDVELDERVVRADVFQALDDTERAIIYLRLVREMGGQEAAAQLGISESRVRRTTRAALAKLRGTLEGSAFPGAPQVGVRTDNAPPAGTRTSQTQSSAARANSAGGNGGPAASSGKPAYSGRILVRMPQTLHDELARAAESERVSLNQFITNALSAAIGWQRPHPQRMAPRWLPAAIVTNILVVLVAGIAAMILLLVALEKGL